MVSAEAVQATVDDERKAAFFFTIISKLAALADRVRREGDEYIAEELRQELGEIKADRIVFRKQWDCPDTDPLRIGLRTAYLVVQQSMRREACCNECECLFTPQPADEGRDRWADLSCPNCGGADIEPIAFFHHPIAL